MTENRYDDELLSAIIDGEATPEQVASVHADPIASERLSNMEQGVALVKEPVPDATAERRSQSIAAAMAAATPASQEVASLSAQRHKREEAKRGLPTGWLVAAAAAILLFVLAIPTIFDTGTAADTATTEAAADDAADGGDDADGDDSADTSLATEGVEAEAEEEEAAEDVADAAPAQDADEPAELESTAPITALDEDDAGGDDSSADAAAAPEEFVDLDVQVVASIEELDLLISDATISPQLTGEDILAIDTSVARSGEVIDEVLATEVNPECLDPGAGLAIPTPYSIVVLDPFAGGATLVIVEFADDGTTRLLDAETCAVLR